MQTKTYYQRAIDSGCTPDVATDLQAWADAAFLNGYYVSKIDQMIDKAIERNKNKKPKVSIN